MTVLHSDVLVVGAGPAGSTAATLLARAGRTVTVVDKAVFPRDKLCGGLVTQKGLDINLPAETQQAQQQQVDSSQIVLEMSADRQMSVNKQIVSNIAELETRLRSIFEQRQEKTMFIAAAGSLRYGEIVAVIDAAKGAGVEKVGIVTEGMRRAAGVQTGN